MPVNSKEEALGLAAKYGNIVCALVENWLDQPEHAKQAAKDWDGFAELMEYAAGYNQTIPVLRWLENRRNLENAAKHWKGFAKLVKYMKKNALPAHPMFRWLKYSAQLRRSEDWGEFGLAITLAISRQQEDVIFKWLENPANLRKATERGEEFKTLLNRIGTSKRTGAILDLLTTDDTEHTAKNWADFSDFKLIKRSATDAESDREHMLEVGLPIRDSKNRERDNVRVIYHNIVFDWIEDPAKLKEKASNWGFTEESKQKILKWLADPEHLEHAKKDWGGFASLANYAKDTNICNSLFAWLDGRKNLKKASKDWRRLARTVASAGDGTTLKTKLRQL